MLPVIRLQEIKLESLDDGPGLLPYKLGAMKITTHYHTFIQYVQLSNIEYNIRSLKTQLIQCQNRMNNDTYSLYEIQIKYLTNKLGNVLRQLQSLEPNRAKRGLVDGLGSIIKSITGNLDHNDALKYNEAIKVLEINQDKVLADFNKHVSLSKEWMSKHSNTLTQIVKNQAKINSTLETILQINTLKEDRFLRYTQFAQLLEVINDNVEDLVQELIRIENSLAFIRASSTHHSMIDIEVLDSMIKKLRVIYGEGQIIDLELREYYDIIKPGSYYVDKQIVFVFKFPIFSTISYDFYRLSIVPNKHAQALIPSFPFLATNEMSYVYIEAECPKLKTWYLCEKEVTHQVRSKADCIQELITNQALQESCQFTNVTLMKEAMEKLDDQHYVLSFPQQTKTQLICKQKDYTMLQGSYLATIPMGCHLKTEEFTIANDYDEIKGQPLKLTKIPYDVQKHATATHIELNSIDLQGLHNIQDKIMNQAPVQLDHMQVDAIYHTTIPFYGLLLCAGVITIIMLTRRYRCKCNNVKEKDQQIPAIVLEGNRNLENIPATFSLNVLK